MGWGKQDSFQHPRSWGLQPQVPLRPWPWFPLALELDSSQPSMAAPSLPPCSPCPPAPISSTQQLEDSFVSSSDHSPPSFTSSMAFLGSKEKIQAFCDLQSLAHLSHPFSGPCPSHSASFVPPTCSPTAELLQVSSVLL